MCSFFKSNNKIYKGYKEIYLQVQTMSATFKNAKKKLYQTELRKFMNEHKTKQKEFKKIESPLAKYNEQGQLTCVLCKSIVRSEAVWTIHVNAKQHKQNVELAKKFKERTNNFTTSLKRPISPPLEDRPEKRIKGILKNSNVKKTDSDTLRDSFKTVNSLPQDFFISKHNGKINTPEAISQPNGNEKLETQVLPDCKDILPEGFFDDPKLDAKARNQEYKDPIEEEWEKFMKAIKEADNESNAIIAEDQEEATTERQIDEIDEQLSKLSRVLDLEKKKVQIITLSTESKSAEVNEDENEMEDNDFDEFLDWRAKSFK